MASVSVNSGEFPLLRNVNINHQPNRSKVVTAWLWMFKENIPDGLNNLADVIEDVYTYKMWEDYFMDTPSKFFEYIGVSGLNLDEPARLIATLRGQHGEDAKKEVFELVLGKHGRNRFSESRGSNGTSIKRGNINSYTLARLKRDRPDLLDRVIKKELSANAAAIEAGFRNPVFQASVNTPEALFLEKIIKTFGKQYALNLAEIIQKNTKID